VIPQHTSPENPTNKTYLWKSIATKLHFEGKIVLAIASYGIATLLLQGGRTTPLRFYNPTCDVRQGTHLTKLFNHMANTMG
jgi:hypothetical protein